MNFLFLVIYMVWECSYFPFGKVLGERGGWCEVYRTQETVRQWHRRGRTGRAVEELNEKDGFCGARWRNGWVGACVGECVVRVGCLLEERVCVNGNR